jgi:hypothetical protein
MSFDAGGVPVVDNIQRVNTPPLQLQATSEGKARGFFFDLTPPAEGPSTPSTIRRDPADLSHSSSSKTSKSLRSLNSPGGGGNREWWDDSGNDRIIRGGRKPVTRASFVLDVPEHLPSSPLCPMHPKHKSEGKGICPLHGRKKSEDCEGKAVMRTRTSRYSGTGGSGSGTIG